MSKQISRATIVFSCLGHLYIHLTAAAFMQVIGGHLADRYPLKPVNVGAMPAPLPAGAH